MKSPHRVWDHMVIFRVAIITGPVEIRWHYGSVINLMRDDATLTVVGLVHLNTRNFGYGIGPIGCLKLAC